MVYLSGNTDLTNDIIVAFSETNDPTGNWNLYAIDGNPFDNGTWSDYPALGLSKNDFFITINLLITGESWQTGFDGSIVWQIDKESGFNGDELETELWSGITHESTLIRNMHPISGGSGLRDSMYFISNRNFDLTNDTIFVISLFGHTDDPDASMIQPEWHGWMHHMFDETPDEMSAIGMLLPPPCLLKIIICHYCLYLPPLYLMMTIVLTSSSLCAFSDHTFIIFYLLLLLSFL